MDSKRIGFPEAFENPVTENAKKPSPKNISRVCEIEELRNANRKIFRMSDGSTQAAFYPHTKAADNKGSILNKDADKKYYRAQQEHFCAAFSCRRNNELFSFEQGNHRITLFAAKGSRHRKPSLVAKLRATENESNVLVFENAHTGADLEYTIHSDGIKENIVIKEASAEYRYTFVINCENVAAKLNTAANRVAFISKETGEEVFFIPAPFMVDASNAVSHGISYEMETAADGTIDLTVVADPVWVNAQNRAFPVVIDPQIILSGTAKINTYSWVSGVMSTADSHTVGMTAADTTYAANRMYMSFTLPTLPLNPRIKKAELTLCQKAGVNEASTTPKLALYQVSGSISTGEVTPTAGTSLIDYEPMKTATEDDSETISYTFDITKLMDASSASHRLVLQLLDETLSSNSNITLYGADNVENPPCITITYESSNGVNSGYRCHTHELGRFGKGSIDLACGNLMFECEDFTWGGNRMPVTLKHLYNSALSGHHYAYAPGKIPTADFNAMWLGLGWRLNIMQSMIAATFCYDGEEYSGYVYIDEDGNEVYFKQSEKQASLTDGTVYNLYEAVTGDDMVYDPQKLTLTQGDDRYLFDSVGRLIRIADASNNQMGITYANNRITSVIDGIGRAFTFSYDSYGFLTAITAPDGSRMQYTYNSYRLTGVTYPDGRSASLSYSGNPISSVALLDASGNTIHRTDYGFNANRLARVLEYGIENGTLSLGAMASYYYSVSARRTVQICTEAADADEGETASTSIITVYSFDDEGNVVGEYVYSQDLTNTGVDGSGSSGIHPYAGEGGMTITGGSSNLLYDHNFNVNRSWSPTSTDSDVTFNRISGEKNAKFGRTYLTLFAPSDTAVERGIQRTAPAVAGWNTFSIYMRVVSEFVGSDNPGAYIRVLDAAGHILGESEHLTRGDREYTRLVVPFQLYEDQNVTVQVLMNGYGGILADAAQLEKNAFASPYNHLSESSFYSYPNSWNASNGVEFDNTTYFDMGWSAKMTGALNAARYVRQNVPVCCDRATRETFTLSGWAKGTGVPVRERDGVNTPTYQLRAVLYYEDSAYGDYSNEIYTADFSPAAEDWQYVSVQFSKSKYRKVSHIIVSCEYSYNSGTVYFDNIQLVRNSLETGLSSADFFEEDLGYNDSDYTEADTTPDFEELSDTFGNPLTETTFANGEFGTVYRSFGYDNSGNNLIRETDARGNVTTYTVDPVTSRNQAITDRCGSQTCYEYDTAGRTAKVTSKDAQSTELANVSYSYDAFDNLTQIVRGDGLKYVLQYDGFHNLEAIGIDGKTESLVTYAYKPGNGRLKSIIYANGDTMKVSYNPLGQMTSEKWYDAEGTLTAHYQYGYDGQGNIVRSIDILALKEYSYIYEEGQLIQAAESDISVSADGLITSKSFVSTVRYFYDAAGTLTRKRMCFCDGSEQVIYYETAEGENTVVKFEAGGQTVTSHSKTDSFGRKVFDELQLGTGFLSRQFDYLPGQVTDAHLDNSKLKSSPVTHLVSRILFDGGRTLSYEYDAEERITKVIDSVAGTTEYTYDALGQLLTETVNGTVVNTMTYDSYGNILTRNGKVYTYGDSVWKDKLTAFDGQTISYDAQGNPTAYLGHTLTWEKGRQLKSFDSCTYTYNANGIRTGKTVNEVTHTYTLDGTKILKETWDGNTLIPLYDNEESICGILYNDTPFYFLKNLQSDVIAITDANGDTVANYSYDAWGVCTVTADTSACSIATINPYRYRGYYYDAEIGMYYLQSRYYDPTVGRFINGDEVLDNRKSSGSNLFVYCWNSPATQCDPSGLYTASLVLAGSLTASLSSSLAGIMAGITSSVASVKAAIATSWLIPICVAAAAIAIIGITYVIKKVASLATSASRVVSAVKAKVKAKGVASNKLRNYTVYVIVRKGTVDVVYVGMTKNYSARYSAHKRRFSTTKYTMMPIATGLTRTEARVLEQTIITAYTLDTLKNMINSISPKKWSNFKTEFDQITTLIESWLAPE